MAEGYKNMPIIKSINILSADIANVNEGNVKYRRKGDTISIGLDLKTSSNSTQIRWTYPDGFAPWLSIYHKWMADGYKFYLYFYPDNNSVILDNNAPANYYIDHVLTFLGKDDNPTN